LGYSFSIPSKGTRGRGKICGKTVETEELEVVENFSGQSLWMKFCMRFALSSRISSVT